MKRKLKTTIALTASILIAGGGFTVRALAADDCSKPCKSTISNASCSAIGGGWICSGANFFEPSGSASASGFQAGTACGTQSNTGGPCGGAVNKSCP